MKRSALIHHCRLALLVAVALATVSLLSSCGSTIYGMGVDLERIGNRMQGDGRPSQGYQAPTQQAPAQNYYPQQTPNNGAWSYYQ